MRLFFSGAPAPDISTLKRLLVLGKTICLADRPSVSLGKTGFIGTVGMESPLKHIDNRGQAVTVEVYEPPSGPAGPVYAKYIEADFSNPPFIAAFVNGLRTSDAFAAKMVQLNVDYGQGLTGAMMRDAILAMPVPQRIEPDFGGVPLGIESRDPLDHLRWLLLEASIDTTVTQLVTEHADAAPVSDDPIMGQLLGIRTDSGGYGAPASTLSPYLGMELVKAVIPDAVLQQLEFTDILEYRKATADVYDAWQTELERISVELDEVDAADAAAAITKKITTELMPKVESYRNEITSASETFLGDMLKGVALSPVPALAAAYLGHGLLGAALAFVTTSFAGTAASAIENVLAIRRAQRSNSISYLVNLTN